MMAMAMGNITGGLLKFSNYGFYFILILNFLFTFVMDLVLTPN